MLSYQYHDLLINVAFSHSLAEFYKLLTTATVQQSPIVLAFILLYGTLSRYYENAFPLQKILPRSLSPVCLFDKWLPQLKRLHAARYSGSRL